MLVVIGLLAAGAVYGGAFGYNQWRLGKLRENMGSLVDVSSYRHLSPSAIAERTIAFIAAGGGSTAPEQIQITVSRGAPKTTGLGTQAVAFKTDKGEGEVFTVTLRAPVRLEALFVREDAWIDTRSVFRANRSAVTLGVAGPSKGAIVTEGSKRAMPPIGLGALNTLLEAMDAHRAADKALRRGLRSTQLRGRANAVREIASQTVPRLGVAGPSATLAYAGLLDLLDRALRGDQGARAEYLRRRVAEIAAMRTFLDAQGIFTPPFE